ncbi:outer membrane protein, bacterial surface antigen family [Reinekea sp. MED297]|uniref:Outer membrane protein assembly factor BamA n=1 Tax=Reinekea blandensis MED297 TaxID=314283 RepID=A4BCG4_9GAMM|nr:outer membrane protein, bacterial surface antigen family [Reinekea sp. MED297] [Reinekea blandensis MED297]
MLTAMSAVALAESFVVEEVRVEGLQRVSLGSVLAELSLNQGDRVDEADASEWLRDVYSTGYFYDVRVERSGNSLVFVVIERPAIESISFDGNSTIPTETLERVFEDVGLAEGEIYSQSLLENIQLELEKQYGLQGRYNATVVEEITALTRNRVKVHLDIQEGPVARVEHYQIVGNQVFSTAELRDTLNMAEADSIPFWKVLSKADNYSKAALTGDVQRLEDFYFDRGYLDFSVVSQQVSISENKADITVALNIREGVPYDVASVEVVGDLKGLDDDILQQVSIEAGQTYSRVKVNDSVRNIKSLLGENGYAFAQVRDFRQPQAESQTVDVVIQVNPGKPVYINRIIIQGNTATNDEVIRRELRQLERALVINDKIRQSQARLERLGYFTRVNIETQTIPGRDDLVDLLVTVAEAKDSQINIAGGYAAGSGFFGEFSVQQNNFAGMGVDFSAGITVNESTQNYQLSVDNPYFTIDGVSLGADLYYKNSDYSETTFGTYATNSYGGRINLGYPISENQRVSYGLGYSRDELFLSDTSATLEMTDFREQNGDEYNIATALFGWNYNTLNGTLKADDGSSLSFNAEVATPAGDLNYYRLTAAGQTYINFADNLALRFHSDVGYGGGYGDNNRLPFYKNFYSGGARSVRGFRNGSLGPVGTAPLGEDNLPAFDASPIGGNIKLEAGTELLIPTPFAQNQDAFRTALFVDAGNVFTDQCRADNPNCENGVDLSEIRLSAGVDVTWITAIAPLSFSYAWPLNAKDDDLTTNFAFNIGISY